MFRKLQDRVAVAASSVLGNINSGTSGTTSQTDIERLQALGNYSVDDVRAALQTTGGNIDRAAEVLLSQTPSSTVSYQNTPVNNYPGSSDEDMDLQRALQQSLDMNEAHSQSSQPSPLPPRTDVMNQAAEAAMRRADQQKRYGTTATPKKKKVTTTKPSKTNAIESKIVPTRSPVRTKSEILRHHHPDVKLVPKLQDKSIEEQIIRTVDRMKNHPAAIDTLYRALSMISNHPNETKYRRIDTSTIGYQRSVANVPGTSDFLRVMKFHNEHYNQNSPILVLSDPMYDPALIYLGVSALEQIKLTPEYVSSKKLLVFTKDVTALLDTKGVVVTPEEIQQRKQYQLLCPQEPADGRGALLQIHITDNYTIRRRFDSDDTISDVLHWIGSTVGTVIYNRILDNTYCLIDVNHVNRIPIPIVGPAKHYTLQYIGCWPSGRLQLQPTELVVASKSPLQQQQQQQQNGEAIEMITTEQPWNISSMGASRGLASGATSSDDE